jgi:nitroreductase
MNEVLNTVKPRRMIQRFEPDLIDDAKVQMILEAGTRAPSFSNLQPWRYIVIKDKNLRRVLKSAENLVDFLCKILR